ncbi:MAG: DUF4364 family protein, partial [Clostridia bacterium]
MQGLTQDRTQNKLILLFIFDKMEMPLSENTIIDLCTNKNNWIAYMNCKLALEELVSSNFVCVLTGDGAVAPELLYNITSEGRVCLAHFFVRIPGSTREMISNYVKASRMSFRRKQEYVSTYEKRQDGTYDVYLKIVDETQPTMEIKINVASRNIAKYIDKTWESKAPQAYTTLYDLL